jgi:hypothetical protein
MLTADQVRVSPLAELERTYEQHAAELPLVMPRGSWRGEFLSYVDSPGAKQRVVRLLDGLAFERTPFGVDFDARTWWFFRPDLRIGFFDASAGPSRWRNAEVLRLRYLHSYLPGFVKRRLYDEVKPLSPTVLLGLGGLNAERGRGDHFYFLLTPV